MSLFFPQSTFGRNHHTVRNTPRLYVQKDGLNLFHFEVCHQLFASVWKTLWFCDHLGIFAVFPIIHDTVVPLKIGSLSFSWCCSKFVIESSMQADNHCSWVNHVGSQCCNWIAMQLQSATSVFTLILWQALCPGIEIFIFCNALMMITGVIETFAICRWNLHRVKKTLYRNVSLLDDVIASKGIWLKISGFDMKDCRLFSECAAHAQSFMKDWSGAAGLKHFFWPFHHCQPCWVSWIKKNKKVSTLRELILGNS